MPENDTFTLEASRALHARAVAVLPGGVNASARLNPALGHALFMQRGEGAYLWDVDGHRYIDYCLSHGASLLGHAHPAVVQAVHEAMARGVLLACETEIQVRVAERLLKLFPGADMLRFTGSGTEATWHAARIARAFTGRWGVLKFEGHYHGVNDTLGYSHWPKLDVAGSADFPRPVPDSAGIPPSNNALITMLPFNDVAALERTITQRRTAFACLIMEPINYDSAGIRPTPEFLQAVRDLTARHGIVLIFDEVLSGFRVRAGGALGDAATPDMTVLGKAVGGGMPVSVILGRRDIMSTCTPIGPASHSGTYNAPPVLIAAVGAFLDVATRTGFYEHLDTLSARLYAGMREIMARRAIRAWVQGVGARFGLLFGVEREPRSYRDIAGQDLARMGRFHMGCLRRGVYLHHVSPHHGFSGAHTLADIETTLDVMDQAAADLV